MSRSLTHVFLSKVFSDAPNQPSILTARNLPVRINRPGRLKILAQAKLNTLILPKPPPGPGEPPPAGTKGINSSPFNFKKVLLDPDGNRFTRDSVTMEDLNKYRDLRGFVRPWTLRILQPDPPEDESSEIVGPLKVSVVGQETVATSSAPPLVDVTTKMSNRRREFEFDLYRVGRFSAKARKDSVFPFGSSAPVLVTLFRPDGSVAGTDNDGSLGVPITLTELRHSRGPDGTVRKWKLRVEAANDTTYKITAQVIETVRLPGSVLKARLDAILGPNGEHLTLGADFNEKRDTNQFTLRIKEARLAETFELHDVLEGLDPSAQPDGADVKRPATGVDYVLTEDRLVLRGGTFDIQAKCRKVKTTSIRILMGASVERRALKLEPPPNTAPSGPHTLQPTGDVLLPPNLPQFSLDVAASGSIIVDVNNLDNGELVIPKLRLEVGVEIKPDGRLGARCWLDPNSVKFGGDEGTIHPVNAENRLKLKLDEKSRKLASSFTGIFEGIFDRLMGGAFRFTASRWTGTAMEFDYVAGVEPERKPNPGYVARGDFGIGIGPVGPIPKQQIDTWKSPNLSKIDHIVVLMMENRSFDHVLGYLSLEPPPVTSGGTPGALPDVTLNGAINPNVDGLTRRIVEKFSVPGTGIRPLSQAGFRANKAGLKTQLPLSVGHTFEHVRQQLANKTMKGFAANFAAIHDEEELKANGCQPQDALGFYTAADLAMYGFVASEFAICDRYFCSHPGPTLPNRMYSLIGDLQRDRNGEPRINNGVDSTFLLSRDQNIFDLLSQRSVSWRVYESFPSVTMLRMFSRYAGDETNIRDIRSLEKDILTSGLPSVTFIDPALHDAPANDDHPPADMLRGQHLIRRIYEALRANKAVWNKTMLIVSYDEHGGFFDHVPPAVAEVLQDPRKVLLSQPVSAASVGAGAGVGAGVTGGGVVVNTDGPAGGGSVPINPKPLTPPLLPNEEIIYGVRVPTFIISPLVGKGAVLKRLVDHASILKTILIKFCANDRPFLSDRVHHAFDLGSVLTQDVARDILTPAPTLPVLPEFAALAVAKPSRIIRKREITGDSSEWHDFMEVLSRTLKR
jgi:phospholipase C